VTATGKLPAIVAVPEMAPLCESIENPPGRPLADHVSGAVPPAALSAALYATPTRAPGNETAVIARLETIASV
jgi:hypothetical protein